MHYYKKLKTGHPKTTKSPTIEKIIGDLKMAAAYSTTVRSTIGDGGLNFSVRNGKRWDPAAIAA